MRGKRTPGSRKEESQKYYLKNKEKILIQTKEYHLKNPEINKKASYKFMEKLREENPSLYLWRHIRTRAKERNIEFNLEVSDFNLPKCCPVLGVELSWGTRNQHDYSPSVDRLDPSKGYIKGNINIISEKANRIKSNASSKEIRKVADWMDSIAR